MVTKLSNLTNRWVCVRIIRGRGLIMKVQLRDLCEVQPHFGGLKNISKQAKNIFKTCMSLTFYTCDLSLFVKYCSMNWSSNSSLHQERQVNKVKCSFSPLEIHECVDFLFLIFTLYYSISFYTYLLLVHFIQL